MIHSISVVNYLGEELSLDLRHPEKSGLAVRNVSGLGPPKAYINATSRVTDDGSDYVSARAESRTITLDLLFFPHPDIESSRLLSYRFFPIKKELTFTVTTDQRKASIVGYVESNEPSIFEKMSGCTVTIICPESYFHSDEDFSVKLETHTAEPAFEFEFGNESLSSKLMEFGVVSTGPVAFFDYPGDSDVGGVIEIKAWGDGLKSITLTDLLSGETFTVNVPETATTLKAYPVGAWADVQLKPPLTASSVITIDTRRKQKRVLLSDSAGVVPAGGYANILNWVDLLNSKWFRIHDGMNIWSYEYTAADGCDPQIEVRVTAPVSYQGV